MTRTNAMKIYAIAATLALAGYSANAVSASDSAAAAGPDSTKAVPAPGAIKAS